TQDVDAGRQGARCRREARCEGARRALGAAALMGMFFHDRGEAPPERPVDPEVRRANMRRIGHLFKPYWRRLSGLLGLIVVSAGLGVVPAFLLRRVLVAIQAHDTR